jgi:hypothetical protein
MDLELLYDSLEDSDSKGFDSFLMGEGSKNLMMKPREGFLLTEDSDYSEDLYEEDDFFIHICEGRYL